MLNESLRSPHARRHTPHSLAPVTPPSADLAQQSLGEIAVALPGATAVFRRLKLDFCCGGQVRLVDACAAKGLDADALVTELKALVRDDWPPPPPSLRPWLTTSFRATTRCTVPNCPS